MTSALNTSSKLKNVSNESVEFEYKSGKELAAEVFYGNLPNTLPDFASACCVIFILIGIPGNLTTVIALARCKKVRNATAILIINLHISDFLYCCMVLPISAMTFAQKRWTHGLVMCHLQPLLYYVLKAASIKTILAITLNRYIMVCHPLIYPRLYKKRNISMMLFTIWILSFALFLPTSFGVWGKFDLDKDIGSCSMVKTKNGGFPKKLYLCVAFFGPCLLIVLCYARIWYVVKKTAKKCGLESIKPTHMPISHSRSDTSTDGKKIIVSENSTSGNNIPDSNSNPITPNEEKTFEKYFRAPFRLTRRDVRPKSPTRRDKKLFTMITAIILSFCITYLPILMMMIFYEKYGIKPIINIFARLLGDLGSCINPIIYVIMSNEYRQAYKSLFENLFKKIKGKKK